MRGVELSVALLCVMVSLATALVETDADQWAMFQDFNTRYSRRHKDDSEKMYRFKVFQESLVRQERLNEFEAVHKGTAMYGVNKFSDLTPEEFKGLYLSGISPSLDSCGVKHNYDISDKEPNFSDPPTSFDWRDKGVIGGIRDQKKCGSCWAFAVVETIESSYAIETGTKLSHILSSQQLISCEYNINKGLLGCRGGNLCEAFRIAEEGNMTLVEESDYPFVSENGETYACRADLPKDGFRLVHHNYHERLHEDVMKTNLVSYSPLTISINAVSWQDYIGGIIQHHCTGLNFDHAVQVVGYNMTGDVPHWIIRNTWGTNWGEDGYIRIKYGDNMCGVSNQVAFVTKVNRVE